MTAEIADYLLTPVTSDDTGWLAAQVEAFVAIRDERDRARRWAVGLEQENADLLAQIAATREWTAGGPCECRTVQLPDGSDDAEPCSRCIVLSYLQPARGLFLHYGNPRSET